MLPKKILIIVKIFKLKKGDNSCPIITNCTKECIFGRVKSAKNCEICECSNPCDEFDCPENNECVVEELRPICHLSKFFNTF